MYLYLVQKLHLAVVTRTAQVMAEIVLPNLPAQQVYIPHPECMWHTTALMRLAYQKEKMTRPPGMVMKLMIKAFPADELADFFENVGHDLDMAVLGFDHFFAYKLEEGQPPLDILENMGKVMNNIKKIHTWADSMARIRVGAPLHEFMVGLTEEAMRIAFLNEFKSYSDDFLRDQTPTGSDRASSFEAG